MKNTLILTYVDSANTIECATFSPTNQIIGKAQTMLISELPQKVELKKFNVLLLINSPEICIREIALPKNISESKYSKVIPNLLEEEIISPIDEVHFSYQKRQDKKLCVAIVSKQKMDDWLQSFKSYGIEPQKIIPLCLTLPYTDKEWTVQLDSPMAQVRTGLYTGFSIELNQIGKFLQYFYESADTKPLRINFINATNAALAALSLQEYPWAHLIDNHAASFWESLQIQKNSINLLQHSYKSTQAKKVQSTFKTHFVLLASALFLLFTGLEIKDYILLNKNYRELNHQINLIYKDLYPNASAVVNPKARMSQELSSSAQSDDYFFSILLDMGNVLNKITTINLKSLSYKNKILTITIEAKNYADVEAFINQLKQSHLQIEQKETTQQKEKLNATLSLTRELKK